MHYSATQSQGHVEELIGGQSWGGLKVLQLSIPENDCWLISCLNRWIFNFKFVLRQTRYWNGPAHFVALHLKHVPRTNLQKCRRSNTSLCHFQSPLVRDMPKVKFWCLMVFCIYIICMYIYIYIYIYVHILIDWICIPFGPAWLQSRYRALHLYVSLPKMPCCQKMVFLANRLTETHPHRLP